MRYRAVVSLAFRQACGPAHQEGLARAAFVKGSLASAESAVVLGHLLPRTSVAAAVVGGEEDDRVLFHAVIAKPLRQSPDISIQIDDHRAHEVARRRLL